jgi:large subunit ribosomal protein L21
MYAVIQSGGKQYRVQVGDVVQVEKIQGDVGASVVFDRVMMLGGDENVKLGTPTLDGVQVRGTVVDQDRDRKVLIYTYKRRKNSARKTQGHRQAFTAVKIDAIEG